MYTCALLDSGEVRCWGTTASGRLGLGPDWDYDQENVGDNELPGSVPPADIGGSVTSLAAGRDHMCALLEGGAVRCWGENWNAQLGYMHMWSIGSAESPSAAGDVDVGGPVVHVAAARAHTCVLLEGGAMRCWGANDSGQLGYGHRSRVGGGLPLSEACSVDVGAPVASLSAGSGTTCARLETGGVRCWGVNWYGQLGYAHTSGIGDNEVPAAVGDVNVGASVVQVASGGGHTCAVLGSGTVRCWGANWYGQLGYGHTNWIGYNEAPAAAGDVNAGGTAVQVVTGEEHTCALLDSGAVRCWGYNSYGQLGYGHTNRIGDNEAPATAGDVNVGGPVVQLAAGGAHTCALLSNGAVRCWGAGWDGRLGYGNWHWIGDNEAPATAGDVNIGGPI